MKLHRDLATLFSVALLIGSTLVASATPAAAAAPGNDDFAAADEMSSTASGSVTGSNLDATLETFEPGGMTATVWWSWTAPYSGTFLFDTCGTSFTSMPVVYAGDTLATLTDVSSYAGECYFQGWWSRNYQVTVEATSGTTYSIQVGGWYGAMGDITLRWWPAEVPGNDDISAATTLVGSTGSTSGTTRFATAGAGEGFSGSPSVWFTWTPPSAGRYAFDLCGSNFDTRLAVYAGPIGELTYITDDDDSCMLQSALKFDAAAGVSYYIVVAGYSDGDSGDFELSWQAANQPSNDDWADATVISGESGTAYGNATFATSETDDPADVFSTVWWRWTAPHDGLVVFDTCDSNYDQVALTVFTGDSLATLNEEAIDLYGCFDQSMVLFEAISGTSYYLMVASANSDIAADVVLRWQMGVPPANDDFAAAEELSGAGGTVQMNTLFATQEEGEAALSGREHTVWWTWLAPADAEVTFDTCGSSVTDNALGVYVGESVDALSQAALGTNNACDGAGARATFTASAGQLYRIAVGSQSMGDIVLHWPASGVIGAPTVTTHPQATTVTAGSTAQFTVAASGLPVPTVQWQVSMDDGSNWSDLAGAVLTTLNVPTTYAMNGYRYRAVFTSTEGTATSDPALLTVNAFAPQIVTHPVTRSVTANVTVTFTAQASGDPTPTVQWQVSTDQGSTWNDVPVGTSTTLSFSAAYTQDGNQYRAVFTNVGGTATTQIAQLNVTPDASITNLTATVSKGKITVTFTPTGTPTPTHFQCEFTGKGSKGGWVPCSSGDVFKVSAKSVTVRAGYSPSGPWGTPTPTPIGRTAK